MLLSYKPVDLHAQQRLQEEGCVVDISNSFVGSLVGEELDEIHHVIELVLLGPDP